MEDKLWFAGVDTHADFHVLCVVDERERVVFSGRYPANREGYAALERKLGGPDRCARVAIEACGSYGRGVAEHLCERGYEVTEALSPGKRPFNPHGKSDVVDAQAAAEVAARGGGTPLKGFSGPAETISFLNAAREEAVAEATRLSNAMIGLLRRAPAALRERLEKKTVKGTVRAIRRAKACDDDEKGALTALKSQAKRWRLAHEEADALEEEMARIVRKNYRRLLALPGVSVLTAAALITVVGDDPSRIRSQAAFAKMCGACPIPASSGKKNRHRLFRGGNRRANCALHRIVVTRLSHDEATRAYMQRRRGEGKTKAEVIRCLVRYVARQVYNALMAEEPSLVADGFRARRQSFGLTLTETAKRLSTNASKLSQLERGLIVDPRLLQSYDDILQALETERDGIRKIA